MANIFAFVNHNVFCLSAETAARLILFEDNCVIFNIDFQRVLLCNVESAAQFDRKNNSSKFVNFSYNTGSFHFFNSFLSALKDDNRRPLMPIPLNLFCAAIQHKLSFVYIILHLFGYVKTNFYFIFLIILKNFFVFCYLCYRQNFFRVIKCLIVYFKTGERGKK